MYMYIYICIHTYIPVLSLPVYLYIFKCIHMGLSLYIYM